MVMKRGVYAGQTFTQGLGVYANSSITYILNGRCSVFTTHYGLDKTASDDARVAFQIFTDGTKVFDSRNGFDFRLEMGVIGVNRLTLRVLDLNPAAKNKSANWGDANLSCNP
jgi:hypothetical protein